MAFRGCEICKQEIDSERAANDPKTRLCAACSREMETHKERYGGGEFLIQAREEKTTKQGGFDKGSGRSVSTSRIRNDEGVRKFKDDYDAKKHGG